MKAAESSGSRSHTAPATVTPRNVRETAARTLSLVLIMARMSKRAMAEMAQTIAAYQHNFIN